MWYATFTAHFRVLDVPGLSARCDATTSPLAKVLSHAFTKRPRKLLCVLDMMLSINCKTLGSWTRMGENSKSKTANKGKTLLVSTAHLPANPPTSLRGYNCQDKVFGEVNSREKVPFFLA